ncbi:KH domain-containing protein [Edaphobacter bradus]|uniref:KH domain-containing protein n=1 Tax=Edaphobacter bradus TaxID=2259016 RepID=UPI0021DFA5F7|nr:KH domain-containing protein [Edaphobacter bradus]
MVQATQAATGNDYVKSMMDLVTEIACALVDNPESVSVEAIDENEGTVLRLHVAQSDVGKVIGKQGRTARSLRTILAAASMKMKHRFALDIVEENQPPSQP